MAHLYRFGLLGRKLGVGIFLLGRDNPQEPPMRKLVLRFVNNDTGATAIEYGLIAAGISIAIIAVVNGLGTQLNSVFSSISSQLGGGSS
jgi:pilus assembly protein Flp/PilA